MPSHLERYQQASFLLFPCKALSKAPALKGWQHRATADPATHGRWFKERGLNIAIPTGERNGIVVVDVDTQEGVEAFVDRYRDVIRSIVQTPRGGAHFAFRWPGHRVPNAVRVCQDGLTYDLRGDGGYVLAPPSVVDTEESRGRYRFSRGHGFAAPHDLSMFPRELLPRERTIVLPPAPPELRRPSPRDIEDLRTMTRARAWLALRDPAVSGQNGHRQCFTTAVALWRKFRPTADQLWILLCEYNERQCVPCFSESELRHKWLDAMQPYPR